MEIELRSHHAIVRTVLREKERVVEEQLVEEWCGPYAHRGIGRLGLRLQRTEVPHHIRTGKVQRNPGRVAVPVTQGVARVGHVIRVDGDLGACGRGKREAKEE